jgi:hypothetical protein
MRRRVLLVAVALLVAAAACNDDGRTLAPAPSTTEGAAAPGQP